MNLIQSKWHNSLKNLRFLIECENRITAQRYRAQQQLPRLSIREKCSEEVFEPKDTER